VKRKLLVLVLALTLVLLATPLVSAFPWTKPKNNEKFQTWEAVGSFKFGYIMQGDHQYIPSIEKINKAIITFTNPHDTHEITVNGYTYELCTDFLYTEGLCIMTFFDPVYEDPSNPLFSSENRATTMRVYWTYDFSAIPGEIEGTLRMQIVGYQHGDNFVNSLAGTGDLRNVQVKAAASSGFTMPPPTITTLHAGTVIGWPDIPPNPPPPTLPPPTIIE
jgi:hypothetical protein